MNEYYERIRKYVAVAPGGKVVVMPIILDWGKSIRWEARVYPKGAAGPLPADEDSLKLIQAPETWLSELVEAQKILAKGFPIIAPSELPQLKAAVEEIEAELA